MAKQHSRGRDWKVPYKQRMKKRERFGTKNKKGIGIIIRCFNNLRLFFLYNFYKSYLIRKSKQREGFCKKCGSCCKGCHYLNDDNKCKEYNNRPVWCHKDVPIDMFDRGVYCGDNCGYYWEKK